MAYVLRFVQRFRAAEIHEVLEFAAPPARRRRMS